jgi:hypothetical protein
MNTIDIGTDAKNGGRILIPHSAFASHFHLMGGTGKGKTVTLLAMIFGLLLNPFNRQAFFIFDRLGGFTQDLLLWFSSPYCPEFVRKRVVVVQPSNDDFVPTFNPLRYDNPEHGYYRVERATEIILRAWESVNIQAMPRLARWIFNAFWAAAQLGLTISDCVHFLLPGSPYHHALLDLLPLRLKAEWDEITQAKGQEATRILDSSRNRLKPYFESPILRRMFGSTRTILDIVRMMREGKVVVFDLSPRNRLSPNLADTIGGLVINEIIAVIRNFIYPSYLILDEFQNYVGPDLEAALPETRQRKLSLVLSHQTLAQLRRGEHDMTSLIFAAQSRLIYGVQGEDADLLANEVASIEFDKRRVKDEFYTRRQLIKGHRIGILQNHSESRSSGDQEGESDSSQFTRSDGRSGKELYFHYMDSPVLHESSASAKGNARSRARSNSFSVSDGEHEVLIPEYDEFLELSSRTYESFNEQRSEWASTIRNLRTGQALIRLVNEPNVRLANIQRFAPGYLAHDFETIQRYFPKAIERMNDLIERNFHSDFFIPAAEIDREQDERIRRITRIAPISGLDIQPADDSPFSS